jgi:hypothetical protein
MSNDFIYCVVDMMSGYNQRELLSNDFIYCVVGMMSGYNQRELLML